MSLLRELKPLPHATSDAPTGMTSDPTSPNASKHTPPPDSTRYSAESSSSAASLLTKILQETIEATVPLSNPSPFTKRWWTKELSSMKKEKNRLSSAAFRFRYVPDHPSKKTYRQFANKYANEIRRIKKQHWEDWLKNLADKDIFTANKIITDLPSDYAHALIPSLKSTQPNGRQLVATSNQAKSEVLAHSFFPPSPPIPSILTNTVYPEPLTAPRAFTRAQIKRKVQSLSPHKAPGPDKIPNVVLIKCIDLLLDYLYFIFRSILEHETYYKGWLKSTTVVLRKPDKPSYDVPKAYCPIGLLDTIGKLFSSLVAEDLTHLCDKHHLLPSHQFGGRPGHTTTNAILLIVNRIKQAWRAKKVAAVLFLDVQSAFPNMVKEVLLHNMKMK